MWYVWEGEVWHVWGRGEVVRYEARRCGAIRGGRGGGARRSEAGQGNRLTSRTLPKKFDTIPSPSFDLRWLNP